MGREITFHCTVYIFLAKYIYYLFNTISYKQHKSINKIENRIINQIKKQINNAKGDKNFIWGDLLDCQSQGPRVEEKRSEVQCAIALAT